MVSYYVDSCIYLNLWKKEIDESGSPLWFYAREFFEKAVKNDSIIYYSGFLLKEIMFATTKEEYLGILELFNSATRFKRANLTTKEYKEAQRLKNDSVSNISFFDILHVLFARKNNSILITRDKEVIEFAKNLDVEAKRPEEIL